MPTLPRLVVLFLLATHADALITVCVEHVGTLREPRDILISISVAGNKDCVSMSRPNMREADFNWCCTYDSERDWAKRIRFDVWDQDFGFGAGVNWGADYFGGYTMRMPTAPFTRVTLPIRASSKTSDDARNVMPSRGLTMGVRVVHEGEGTRYATAPEPICSGEHKSEVECPDGSSQHQMSKSGCSFTFFAPCLECCLDLPKTTPPPPARPFEPPQRICVMGARNIPDFDLVGSAPDPYVNIKIADVTPLPLKIDKGRVASKAVGKAAEEAAKSIAVSLAGDVISGDFGSAVKHIAIGAALGAAKGAVKGAALGVALDAWHDLREATVLGECETFYIQESANPEWNRCCWLPPSMRARMSPNATAIVELRDSDYDPLRTVITRMDERIGTCRVAADARLGDVWLPNPEASCEWNGGWFHMKPRSGDAFSHSRLKLSLEGASEEMPSVYKADPKPFTLWWHRDPTSGDVVADSLFINGKDLELSGGFQLTDEFEGKGILPVVYYLFRPPTAASAPAGNSAAWLVVGAPVALLLAMFMLLALRRRRRAAATSSARLM